MKIKILKDEYLFNEQGLHIIDENGFAIKATEDTECEVSERADFILELLKVERNNRGLDENGDPIPPPQPEVPEEVQPEVPSSDDESGVENGI